MKQQCKKTKENYFKLLLSKTQYILHSLVQFRGQYFIQKFLYSLKEMQNFQSSQNSSENDQRINSQVNPYFRPEKKNLMEAATIDQLYSARDKLRKFATIIDKIKNTPLRADVVLHCQKVDCKKKDIFTFQHIDNITKNRIEKMLKNKKIKRNWSKEDIYILIWVVSKYADHMEYMHIQRDLKQDDWEKIAELIPGVTGLNCMFKWLNLKKIRLIDKPWSQQQSLLLGGLVAQYGEQSWSLLSFHLYKLNKDQQKVYRTPKQCRQQWNCFLKKDLIKGTWKIQQDLLLFKAIRERNGNKKWTELAKLLGGRTQNALKNRFNLLIEKLKNFYQNVQQRVLIDQFLKKHNILCTPNNKVEQSQPVLSSFQRVIFKENVLKPNYSQLKQIDTRFSKKINDFKLSIEECSFTNQQQNKVMLQPTNNFTAKIQENHIIQLNYSQSASLNKQIVLRLNPQTILSTPKKTICLKNIQNIKTQQVQRIVYHIQNPITFNDEVSKNSSSQASLKFEQISEPFRSLIKINPNQYVIFQNNDTNSIKIKQQKE